MVVLNIHDIIGVDYISYNGYKYWDMVYETLQNTENTDSIYFLEFCNIELYDQVGCKSLEALLKMPEVYFMLHDKFSARNALIPCSECKGVPNGNCLGFRSRLTHTIL